ncbi:S-adenosyl-L-methionine-dependent methyltransferase [Panus rudis PR-1116 ss-1]|nr:S-adenosyl-L-methionine-dependent methyltransferase [Panus rudis PR-1116 ss-1]
MSSSTISRFSSHHASSVTSGDIELRTPSPQPSVFSVTSSVREAAYRQEYGRNLNNYSEVYSLPADDEELERLNHQHEMFKIAMGKYPPGLPEVLAEVPGVGEQKSAVDLGCGSGSWILDVAQDFPHCNCVAIDLVPMQNTNMPPNCRSEIDDINLGLQHYYEQFNVVHARLICTGIKDYAGLVDHIAQTLRPDGLVALTEYNFIIHDAHRRPIEIPDNDPMIRGPWLPRWMKLAQWAIRRKGGEVDAADHLYRWVSEHGAFDRVVKRQFWFQASPWNRRNDAEAIQQNELATTMREDMLAFLRSGRPLLLGAGISEEIVNRVENEARIELIEAKTPLLILIENVYGRRRQY